MKIKAGHLYASTLVLVALSVAWAAPGQVREPVDSTPVLAVGSVSASPEGLTEIPIYVRNLAGRNASALQFDLFFDVRWAEVLESKAGDAALRANKQVVSNRLPTESRVMYRKLPDGAVPAVTKPGPGKATSSAAPQERNSSPELVPVLRQRIVVAGMDNTPLGDGIIAYLVLRMRDVVPEGQIEIGIDRCVISDANARPLPVRQQTGWITSRSSRLSK